MPDAPAIVFIVTGADPESAGWTARALNAHPDLLCFHDFEGVRSRVLGRGRLPAADTVPILRESVTGAVAVGDCGVPTAVAAAAGSSAVGGVRTAILLRHPVCRVEALAASGGARGGGVDDAAEDRDGPRFVRACRIADGLQAELDLGARAFRTEHLAGSVDVLDDLVRHLTDGAAGVEPTDPLPEPPPGLVAEDAPERTWAAWDDRRRELFREHVGPATVGRCTELGYDMTVCR